MTTTPDPRLVRLILDVLPFGDDAYDAVREAAPFCPDDLFTAWRTWRARSEGEFDGEKVETVRVAMLDTALSDLVATLYMSIEARYPCERCVDAVNDPADTWAVQPATHPRPGFQYLQLCDLHAEMSRHEAPADYGQQS